MRISEYSEIYTPVDDYYFVATDKTQVFSLKYITFKTTIDNMCVLKNQGVENAGKRLVVKSDGTIGLGGV